MNVNFGIAVLLAVVMAAQPGQTLICYECQGFVPSQDEHPFFNVKGCGDDTIPADSKIMTRNETTRIGPNAICIIISYQNKDWNNGKRVAKRAAVKKGDAQDIEDTKFDALQAIQAVNSKVTEDDLKVEYCQTDKCSGATGHIASTLAVAAAALFVLSRQ